MQTPARSVQHHANGSGGDAHRGPAHNVYQGFEVGQGQRSPATAKRPREGQPGGDYFIPAALMEDAAALAGAPQSAGMFGSASPAVPAAFPAPNVPPGNRAMSTQAAAFFAASLAERSRATPVPGAGPAAQDCALDSLDAGTERAVRHDAVLARDVAE